MLVALVAAAVLSGAPPNFTEAKVLEPAASYVAGKPVSVYCARTDLDLREYAQSAYGLAANFELGFAVVGSDSIYLGQSVCWPLLDFLKHRKVTYAEVASALQALVHEAIHARGERDEGVTECDAMHETPRVAVRFFKLKPGKRLRAFMAEAWSAYDALQPQYQTVCGPPR